MADNNFNKMVHAQSITMLFAAYGQTTDRNRMLVYAEALQPIPKDLLLSVIKKSIYNNKFLPSIAELLENCRSLNATISGKKEVPDFSDAWAEIQKAMRETSWHKKPTFSHPVIERSVKNYGWDVLHTCLASDIHVIEAQMRNIYTIEAKKFVEEKRNKEVLGSNSLLDQATQKLLEKQK